MSSPDPFGGTPDPFQGIFGDIVRLLGSTSSGPLNWDVARQIAALIAGQGQAEPNVDPLDRIKLEELSRLAELHVNQLTDLGLNLRTVTTVNHVEWALQTLDAYQPLLERLAGSLNAQPELDESAIVGASEKQQADMEKLMSPMMMGMQAGGLVGHLSRRALGQFDLPIPRQTSDTLVFIPANIATFAQEWSLPKDELTLYVAIEEVTRLAILSKPHVRERLNQLLTDYAGSFEIPTSSFQERMEQLNIEDPEGLPAALSDPQALLGAMQTPQQRLILQQLSALVAAFVGYVDYVVKSVANKTISSASAIAEANKRRRVEESDGARIVERLFGLELTQAQFDRGEAFITGVLERQPQDGLARLWSSARELPTPAEIDAPGLWLERIDLPE